MVYGYNRSDVVNYYELTEEEQSKLDWMDEEEKEEATYVLYKGEPLPLSHFMKTSGKSRYHGIYGISNTAAYGVVLSRRTTEAVVALIG